MDSSSTTMDAERPTFHIYITDNSCKEARLEKHSSPARALCVCVCEVLICSWILKKMLQGIQQTQFGTLNKSYAARISLELIFSRGAAVETRPEDC